MERDAAPVVDAALSQERSLRRLGRRSTSLVKSGRLMTQADLLTAALSPTQPVAHWEEEYDLPPGQATDPLEEVDACMQANRMHAGQRSSRGGKAPTPSTLRCATPS